MKYALVLTLITLVTLTYLVSQPTPDVIADSATATPRPIPTPSMDECRAWIAETHTTDYENHDCEDYADVMDMVGRIGGGAIPVGDDRFYLIWFPEGWERLPDRRLIVTMHGKGGCAESVFRLWLDVSRGRGYAIASLQCAETYGDHTTFDNARVMYSNLVTMLGQLENHCPMQGVPVILHGFSRGSAMNYQLALIDRGAEGLGLFSSFIADSGGPGPTGSANIVPDYIRNAPPDAYEGARFWLYCGMRDNDGQRCEDIEWMMGLLIEHGATIDRFYVDPRGGHGILLTVHDAHPSPALDELLDYIDSIEPVDSETAP